MISKSFVFLTALFSISITARAQVVATVGKNTITMEDFKKRYDEVKKQSFNPPPPETFLEDLLRFEVGVQEAEKKDLQKDPIVKEEVRKVLYKALVETAIGETVNKIQVNEGEMRDYYKKNPELRTSQILIEVKPGSNKKERDAAYARAKEIYDEVKKSARPYEELVKLYSDDNLSKATGGDIGYQTRVTLVPTYYDAAITMKMNEVKGLIETRYGFHIIKLTGTREYNEANKRQIRAAVFDQKRNQIFDKYFEGLMRKYTIKSNKELLKTVK